MIANQEAAVHIQINQNRLRINQIKSVIRGIIIDRQNEQSTELTNTIAEKLVELINNDA